ncbi:glycine--tRNA ligase subunit beta [Sphingomonas lutea]|uniref:Glycine--tRNA ligase beta subunit n=1 Tax=Sphingomonas lutea TaxID=1045317 RepID=A0A7G9SER7_9SPHN|nr:glycine--tRNA ligase subunit beta [Sphingomonas lutea]QNN66342.1 glycine--tRNA ligase subunit beta [Sphingomonas lutea]
MADFLLELLSEEIPARMQARARNDLARMFAERLDEAGLARGAVDVHSTPRRLVLVARDVADRTEASREEIKGPRTSAPDQALEGFLRKTGLTRDQLAERDGVWFAIIAREGRAAADVIAEAVRRIVTDFPWPKSMRWGDGDLRWVRPLQGIVALLGEEIVRIEIDGVTSGASTVGHRFHHPGPITIGSADDYFEKLRACHVIVDQDERERMIREGAAKAAADAGLSLIEDEGLVVENAGLTEWPVHLLGRFDPEFLDVPREVIVLTMRTNQKYFACAGADGGLAPAFVCVANIDAKDGGASIVEGNKRVLAARLADARFFWEQDLKVPLEEQAAKLEQMLFYEGLGSLHEKAERVARLSREICTHWFKERDPDTAYRAGLLAKADLASAMVGEFPELQGVMGSYYAERGGEKPGTVAALRQQYQQSVEGCIPACVALADRIDTLAAFFARGIKPTGSKDPFALRRAALGIIQTIIVNGTRLRLREAFGMAEAKVDQKEIMDFFADRLKVQQREAGIRHDLIDAVFALGGEDDLIRLLARVKALQAFVETPEGRDLLAGFKRAANILKKEEGSWTPDQVRGDGEVAPEEAALVAALDAAEPKASAAIEAEDFTAAMAALASLRGPIDDFFDKVTVNDPDAGTRARRLALLARFRDAVNRVADFSRIEG